MYSNNQQHKYIVSCIQSNELVFRIRWEEKFVYVIQISEVEEQNGFDFVDNYLI